MDIVKINDLLIELSSENTKLHLENEKLKNNRNELKEWMNSEMKRFEDNPYTRLGIAVFTKVLSKMQEIEGGKNE